VLCCNAPVCILTDGELSQLTVLCCNAPVCILIDGELSQLIMLCCNAPVCILILSTVLPFVCFVRFVSLLVSFSYIFKLLRCHNTVNT